MTAVLPIDTNSSPEMASAPTNATATTGRRRLPGWLRTARMAGFELGLLFRQRTSLLAIGLTPLFILGFPLVTRPEFPDMWRMLLPPMIVLVMVFSIYYTAASIVASRRQLQVFKRLRTSELTTVQMVTAMTTPLLLIGLVQTVVIVTGFVLLGGPMPASLGLLALAAVLTALTSVVAGVAIGSMAPSSERVQYTAMPLLMATAILANLMMTPDKSTWHEYLLFAPFMGPVDLVARGSGLGQQWLTTVPLPVHPVAFDVATSLFWLVVFGFLVVVSWRWEPRS